MFVSSSVTNQGLLPFLAARQSDAPFQARLQAITAAKRARRDGGMSGIRMLNGPGLLFLMGPIALPSTTGWQGLRHSGSVDAS